MQTLSDLVTAAAGPQLAAYLAGLTDVDLQNLDLAVANARVSLDQEKARRAKPPAVVPA